MVGEADQEDLVGFLLFYLDELAVLVEVFLQVEPDEL